MCNGAWLDGNLSVYPWWGLPFPTGAGSGSGSPVPGGLVEFWSGARATAGAGASSFSGYVDPAWQLQAFAEQLNGWQLGLAAALAGSVSWPSWSGLRNAAVGDGDSPSLVADRGGYGPSVRLDSGEYLDLASTLTLTGAFRVHVAHERDSGSAATFLGSASDDSGLFVTTGGEYRIGAGGATWVGPTDAELGPHVVTYARDGADAVAVYRNGVELGTGTRANTLALDHLGYRDSGPLGTTGAWLFGVYVFDGSGDLADELAWISSRHNGLGS